MRYVAFDELDWLLMNLSEIFKSWGFVVENCFEKKKDKKEEEVENFVEKLSKF